MKNTTFIAILLTLLSLLLVAGSTIFFMSRSRTLLEDEISALTFDKEQLNETVNSYNNSLQTDQGTVATLEAEKQTLTTNLQQSQQRADTLDQALTDTETALTNTQNALATAEAQSTQIDTTLSKKPLITFITPEADTSFDLGDTINVLVSASDNQGLITLNVTANGQTIATFDANDQQLASVFTEWQPTTAGIFTLAASAINIQGTASPIITRTITIIDPTFDPLADIRSEIETNVVELRGLDLLSPITPTLLTKDALTMRVTDDLLEDTSAESAQEDAIVLNAFDFLPRDYDLMSYYTDLLTEQVAGFYDPESGEFVVISDDDQLSPSEKLTHAHEFVHALQDQHFDLGLLDEIKDGDAALAYRSFVEGEATFVQIQYVLEGYLTFAELGELQDEITEIDTDIIDSGPPVIINSFTFPYESGYIFAQALYNTSDTYDALNTAWTDLPQSTEHILHPDRYLAGDNPQLVTLPPLTDTLGTGWRQLDQDTFGEFFLREYLSQQLTSNEVDTAATGWGGDQYAVYWHESNDEIVMVYTLVWDTPTDATEFATAYTTYATDLFNTPPTEVPNAQCWLATVFICLYADEDATRIVRAPNLPTITRIANKLRP